MWKEVFLRELLMAIVKKNAKAVIGLQDVALVSVISICNNYILMRISVKIQELKVAGTTSGMEPDFINLVRILCIEMKKCCIVLSQVFHQFLLSHFL